MKKSLALAALLAACLISVPTYASDLIWCEPISGHCYYAPDPPPGGRKCDSRGNTTINPGEFAAYTGNGGWCVTMPGGDYPNMSVYFHDFGGPTYIVNKRSGWPVPPVSSGFYGTNYTGGGINMPQGTYTTSTLWSIQVR